MPLEATFKLPRSIVTYGLPQRAQGVNISIDAGANVVVERLPSERPAAIVIDLMCTRLREALIYRFTYLGSSEDAGARMRLCAHGIKIRPPCRLS